MNYLFIRLIPGIAGVIVLIAFVGMVAKLFAVISRSINQEKNLKLGKSISDYVDTVTERVIRIQLETERLDKLYSPTPPDAKKDPKPEEASISKMENMLADVLREEGIHQDAYNLRAIILGKIHEMRNGGKL